MVLLAALACHREPVPEASWPDVVLVTLDTTRADRLGCYGHAEAHTPWLDALAARGTRFDAVTTVQPLTIPSHASLHTGQWPFHHGVRSNGDAALGLEAQTLAESLHAGGWQTGASVAAFVTTRQWGFDQGFDVYYDTLPPGAPGNRWHQERRADAVVDDAIGWLSEAATTRPLFLWVHLYDAHFPYQPAEPFAVDLSDRPYDGEIATMDQQLARLADALGQRGRTALWAVVGDHGESLGQHREPTHGLFVYDATARVPWILAGPGIPVGTWEAPVSTVDVAPTILARLGLPPMAGADGLPWPSDPRPLYTESWQLTERFGYAPHVAVVDGPLKLISKPRPELYDRSTDPTERTDLAAARPADVARLEAALGALGATPPQPTSTTLDPEVIGALQALGYVGGGPLPADAAALPDPLDHLETIGRVSRAEVLAAQGDATGAAALFEETLAAEPDLVQPALRLSALRLRSGDPAAALAVVEQTLARHPDQPQVLLRAATLVGRAGDDERGLALARRALELAPDDRMAAEMVGGALNNLGRSDELSRFAEAHLAVHPDAAGLAAVAGAVRFDQGDLVGAEPWLRLAMKDPRPRQGVARRLAALAAATDHLDDAQNLLVGEIGRYPLAADTRAQLAGVLVRLGDEGAAREQLDWLLARPLPTSATPVDLASRARHLHTRAVLLFNAGDSGAALRDVDAGLALSPGDPDLLLMLANLQAAAGDLEAAVQTRSRGQAAHEARLEAAERRRDQ